MSRSRGRTISLRGDAARAFVQAQREGPPATEKDELETLAIAVTIKVHQGNMVDAVAILKLFAANEVLRAQAKAEKT